MNNSAGDPPKPDRFTSFESIEGVGDFISICRSIPYLHIVMACHSFHERWIFIECYRFKNGDVPLLLLELLIIGNKGPTFNIFDQTTDRFVITCKSFRDAVYGSGIVINSYNFCLP